MARSKCKPYFQKRQQTGASQLQATNSDKTKAFKENIDEKCIYQSVNFKTFQKSENELTNTLDLIFTENSERIAELIASPPLGNIEKAHLVLKWNFILKNSRLENRNYKGSKLAYKRGDYFKVTETIFEVDWDLLFSNLNTQDSYAEFLRVYNEVCEKNIPLKVEWDDLGHCNGKAKRIE